MSGFPAPEELLADVDACALPRGQCALWWLGQHGFVLKLGKAVLYLDPYLSPSPSRQVPPLLRPQDVRNADLVLGTHDHGDHIDRAAWPHIAAASPAAMFVVPDLLRPALSATLRIPLDRFVGLDDGRHVRLRGVKVSAVPAAHEFLDADPATGQHPYLGYVVEGHGCTVYHAGDTCLYEGMQEKLRKWSLDVAILPINGRDARRLRAGCIGNLTYQEAADLAGAIQPRLTLPAHYDMFSSNREDPALFLDYMQVKYPRLRTALCPYARRLVYSRS